MKQNISITERERGAQDGDPSLADDAKPWFVGGKSATSVSLMLPQLNQWSNQRTYSGKKMVKDHALKMLMIRNIYLSTASNGVK
jgi:hypothetical protein